MQKNNLRYFLFSCVCGAGMNKKKVQINSIA